MTVKYTSTPIPVRLPPLDSSPFSHILPPITSPSLIFTVSPPPSATSSVFPHPLLSLPFKFHPIPLFSQPGWYLPLPANHVSCFVLNYCCPLYYYACGRLGYVISTYIYVHVCLILQSQ